MQKPFYFPLILLLACFSSLHAQFYGVSFDNNLANSGGGWFSSSTNNVFWTTTAVKAPSITGINTTPQNGSGFTYSETDGTFGGSQATSFLESPCFDLSGTITRVQFAYQLVGDIDSFYLEVSFDDGMTYNQQVLSVPTGTVSDWVVDNTTGLNISGSVRFRFAAIFNSGSSSILAIDQLQFFGAQQNEAMDCPMPPTMPDCVENLSLNNATLNEDFYRAKNQLTSNASIATNDNVTFTAGNQIILTEGFVANNTTFTARIEDCNSVGFLLEEDYERSLVLDSTSIEYIDRFGNGYRKDDLAITKSSQNCNSGFFNLIFLSNFTSSQEAVICNVFEDLSDIIIPRSPTPIVNITIEKEALSAINPNIIAVGSAYWQPEDCGIVYSRVEKAIMAADSTDDDFYHGFIKFNPAFLNLLYDGSQSNRDTLLDMYSITLHEAVHVLGFSSFIDDTLGNSILNNVYTRYDQLLYSTEDDSPLIELNTNGDCCDEHIFNPITSNNIRVGCSNMLYLRDDGLIAPVDGENVDVGNLLSHINDECGGQNYVMNPTIRIGEVKDMLTLAEKEVLKNIGYDIVGLSSSCELIAVDDILNDVMVVIDDTLREYGSVLSYDSIVANDVIGIDYDLVFDSLCSDIGNATVSSDGTNINFFTQEAGTYTLCYEIFGCDGACDQGEIILNLNDTTQAVCTGCNITCVSDFETFDTSCEVIDSLVGGESPFDDRYLISAQNSPDLIRGNNDLIGVGGGINDTKSIYMGFDLFSNGDIGIEGIFIQLNESVKNGDTLDFSINAEFINIENTIYDPRVRVDFLSSDPVNGANNSRSVYTNPGVVDSYEYLASDAFYIQNLAPVITGGQIINNTDSTWTWAVISARADTIPENAPYLIGVIIDNIQMNKRRQVLLSSSASPSLSCNEGLYELQYELCNLTDFGSAEMTLDLSIPDGFTVVDGDIFGSDTTVVLADDYIEADSCTIITLLLEQAPNVNIDDVFTFELTQSGSCYNTLVNEKSVRIINNPLSITKSFTENQGTYDILIEVCNSLDTGIDSVRIEDAVPNDITLLSTGGFQQMENLLFQYDSIPANTCVQYAYSMNLPDNFCRGLYFASAEIEGSGCDQALDDINLNTPLVKPTIISSPSSNIFCSAEDFFIDYELFNDHCTSTDSISLELILPTGINLENAGLFANGNTARLGDLAPSERLSFRALLELDPSLSPNTDLEIVLRVNADDPIYQESSDSLTISFINSPLSTLDKTYFEANDTFHFDITVCNSFSDSIFNVEILDNLPPELQVVEAGVFSIDSTAAGTILKLDTLLPPANGGIDACLSFSYKAIATEAFCPSTQRAIARIPDSGCDIVSDTVRIIDSNLASTDSSFTYVISCNTGVADFTANNNDSGISHLWRFGDGDSSLLANPTHTYATQGTYIVTHRVDNGCDTTLSEQIVTYEPCLNDFNCACVNPTFIGTPPSGTTNISQTGLPLNYNNTGQCLQIVGTLVIDSSFTITGGQIVLEPDAEIVVRSNRILTLNTTTLQSCDNYMWRGIQVNIDGNLVIDNSFISDALRAVRLRDDATFQIDDTQFDRNYIGLDILGTPVNLGFSGNTIRCPLPLNNGDWGLYGIRCTNTAFLQIGDESLTQATNRFEDIDYGIVSNFSGLAIYDAIFENLRDTSGIPPVGQNTSIGIYGDISSTITAAQNTFSNLYEGIAINNSTAKIFDNTMDTVNLGINIRNILGFQTITVLNNQINAAQRGIQLNNALAAFPEINNNLIEVDMTNYAYRPIDPVKAEAFAININLFKGITNYMPVNDNEIILRFRNNATFAPTIRGIGMSSCTGVELSNNEISIIGDVGISPGAGTGMRLTDINQVLIKENTIQDGFFFGGAGILAFAATDVSYCCNDINVRENALNFAGVSQGTRLNLNKLGKPTFVTDEAIFCQNGTIIGQQIFNVPGTDLQRHRGNEFISNSHDDFGAVHQGSDEEVEQSQFFVPDSTSIFYPPSSGTQRVDPSDFFVINSQLQSVESCEVNECIPLPIVANASQVESLARKESFTSSPYSQMLNWESNQYLFSLLNSNTQLLGQDAPVDSFWQTQSNTTLASLQQVKSQFLDAFTINNVDLTNHKKEIDSLKMKVVQLSVEYRNDQIGRSNFILQQKELLLQIEELRSRLKEKEEQIARNISIQLGNVHSSNELINTNHILSRNEKEVRAIHLLSLQDSVLEEGTISKILEIADQCPKEGGRYVYYARSLYQALVEDKIWIDSLICEPVVERRSSFIDRSTKVNDYVIQLFPNPSFDKLNINIEGSISSTTLIRLVSITGNTVKELNVDSNEVEIWLNDIPEGIYFCNLYVNRNLKKVERFVVLK